jgi:hypothetical protein
VSGFVQHRWCLYWVSSNCGLYWPNMDKKKIIFQYCFQCRTNCDIFYEYPLKFSEVGIRTEWHDPPISFHIMYSVSRTCLFKELSLRYIWFIYYRARISYINAPRDLVHCYSKEDRTWSLSGLFMPQGQKWTQLEFQQVLILWAYMLLALLTNLHNQHVHFDGESG